MEPNSPSFCIKAIRLSHIRQMILIFCGHPNPKSLLFLKELALFAKLVMETHCPVYLTWP